MVFSGDLANSSELSPLLSKPATVLVCELSHMTPEELAGELAKADLKTLCLVHLSEDLVSDREDLQSKMEELLPAIQDVMIPEDGSVIDF